MPKRGHGAGISPAIDGYRAWELIEGRDGSGSSAGIGERDGDSAGLEWGGTKAQGSVGNRSQKHIIYLEACSQALLARLIYGWPF